MEYAHNATWVLFEPAELLFTYAGQLVYSGDKGSTFIPNLRGLLGIYFVLSNKMIVLYFHQYFL